MTASWDVPATLPVIFVCCLATKLCPTLCDPIDYRLPCPWHFPSKEYCSGLLFSFLFQAIFPIQGSNPCFLHWQADSLPVSHQGSSSKISGHHEIGGLIWQLFLPNEWWLNDDGWPRGFVWKEPSDIQALPTHVYLQRALWSHVELAIVVLKNNNNNNTDLLSSLVCLLSSKKSTVRASLMTFYGDSKLDV